MPLHKFILFVSHDVNRAGAQLFILSIMKRLKSEGNTVILLVKNSWGSLKDEFEANFETYYLDKPIPSIGLFSKPKSAWEVLKLKYQFDLVYVNTIASIDLLPQIKACFLAKTFVHIHELSYSIQQYGPNNWKELLETSDCIISCSKSVLENLSSVNKPNYLVHSFVQNEEILDRISKSSKQETRHKYDLPSDKTLVCIVGNADWRKGHDILPQIILQTNSKTKNIYFVCVGISPDSVMGSQLIFDFKKLGIENYKILSPTDRAVEILNACDIFLLSSREDPFPLVTIEASLCKIPTVGFKNTGGIDEFENENAAMAVDFLDTNEISNKLSFLSENPDEKNRLGKKAFDLVQEKFNFEISFKKIQDILYLSNS
ncbi:MAG: glycosyltransferase family 4 protein [Leadbetterella sp.]